MGIPVEIELYYLNLRTVFMHETSTFTRLILLENIRDQFAAESTHEHI